MSWLKMDASFVMNKLVAVLMNPNKDLLLQLSTLYKIRLLIRSKCAVTNYYILYRSNDFNDILWKIIFSVSLNVQRVLYPSFLIGGE